MHNQRLNQSGFTLIELIVSVGIVAILSSIALPAFKDYREKAFIAKMKVTVRNLSSFIESEFDTDEKIINLICNKAIHSESPSVCKAGFTTGEISIRRPETESRLDSFISGFNGNLLLEKSEGAQNSVSIELVSCDEIYEDLICTYSSNPSNTSGSFSCRRVLGVTNFRCT